MLTTKLKRESMMADSGVDTSNESSDNSVAFEAAQSFVDFEPIVIPLTRNGEAVPLELSEPRGARDHVNKLKCPRARSCRYRYRFPGIANSSCNQKLRFAASTNNVELVEKLLQTGADPDTADEHKRSPLHLAACRGYMEVIRVLLRYGANPNVKDTLGNTPLHLAACTSNIPVITELLAAGTDVTSNDKHGRNPIQLAESKLKLIKVRPVAFSASSEETRQLMLEIRTVVEMMLQYIRVHAVDASDIEEVRRRLERVSTKEQVDNEVQCLLNSLDHLKLR